MVPDISEKFLKVQEEKYLNEKRHEYQIGHDGTWVMDAHFGKIALGIFKKENQIENKLTYLAKFPDLIASPAGQKLCMA